MIDFIMQKPMTLFFIIAGAMVLYQVALQIARNRREARRVTLDTFVGASEVEQQQFEQMI